MDTATATSRLLARWLSSSDNMSLRGAHNVLLKTACRERTAVPPTLSSTNPVGSHAGTALPPTQTPTSPVGSRAEKEPPALALPRPFTRPGVLPAEETRASFRAGLRVTAVWHSVGWPGRASSLQTRLGAQPCSLVRPPVHHAVVRSSVHSSWAAILGATAPEAPQRRASEMEGGRKGTHTLPPPCNELANPELS